MSLVLLTIISWWFHAIREMPTSCCVLDATSNTDPERGPDPSCINQMCFEHVALTTPYGKSTLSEALYGLTL